MGWQFYIYETVRNRGIEPQLDSQISSELARLVINSVYVRKKSDFTNELSEPVCTRPNRYLKTGFGT